MPKFMPTRVAVALGCSCIMAGLIGWDARSEGAGAGPEYRGLPTAVRSTPRETSKPKFGPPPPGYVKIRGEAVPDWTPESMTQETRGAVNWHSLGPRPILWEYWSGSDDASGRVVSIAVHPTQPGTAYAGSASGGVWKTTNYGLLWTPLTDELSNLNQGVVTLDPQNSDRVYVGTGEYQTSTSGDGMFRSDDGGASWVRVAEASEVGSTCSGLIVDPTNSDRIHVTGSGGYARSDDGGDTWNFYLTGNASSLAVDPASPRFVYVGLAGDGIYRSGDFGDTFTKLTNGLPSSDVHRIVLAQSASSPQVLYAAIINGSAGLRGFYRTSSHGDSWTQKTNTPNFPSPQGWYDVFVGVDPTDANTVYCGGVFPSYAVAGIIKTTNGGDGWNDITIGNDGSQVHPDQHTITFGTDGTIWVGNDGGVWISEDDGDTWLNRNETLTVTQNYAVALHPTDPGQLMTGTQDNGTIGRENGDDGWPQLLSGDGGFLEYDPLEPDRRYMTYVYLTVYRVAPGDWAEISGPWGNDSRNFISPLVMDPSDRNVLFGGTNRVWKTEQASYGDGSSMWSAISGSNVGGGGTLNAIAVAPSDSDVIYVGNSAGTVWVTTNQSSWVERSSGLPGPLVGGEISDIVIDPTNPGHAYVAYHRTAGKRVLYTNNYGVNWNDVSQNMPAGVSARALAIDWVCDPPTIYVGTGVGVYTSSDGGGSWEKDGTDLPNVNIGDLLIDPVARTITAATYGRGAWRADLLCGAPPIPGDIDHDGDVDFDDLNLLLAAYGTCTGAPGYNAEADLDGNDCVDFDDLNLLLANYGG